jgi:predicted 3-demethylubiquinone-9 3-methyltransferase (glyoxalase superfamily)
VDRYISIFGGSKGKVTRYGDGAPMPKGTVMTVEFELLGQRLVALNGGPQYKFTEAVSFAVSCESQAEIDRYWDALLAGGGKTQACGWLKDKFGLSWQVVPANIVELMTGPNAGKVTAALWQMVKLDVGVLEAAARGK